jgi:hypothetical protein
LTFESIPHSKQRTENKEWPAKMKYQAAICLAASIGDLLELNGRCGEWIV